MLFATDHTDLHELIKKSAPICEIRGKDVELLRFTYKGRNLGYLLLSVAFMFLSRFNKPRK